MLRTFACSAVRSAAAAQTGLRAKSSISALAYKALHRGAQKPHMPVMETPGWSPDAVISSILYEAPEPKPAKTRSHVLQCLVQNEPGVLSRVAGTLAARGFNIESLAVASTEVNELSRMTICLIGHSGIVEQACRQIEDLVPVWAVLDYTDVPHIQRELLLTKVSLLGPEFFKELVSHHKNVQNLKFGEVSPSISANFPVKDFHPDNLALSEALRHKHLHLDAITRLAQHYGGKVTDISDRNCIVELCAAPEQITAFLHNVRPFGVLEAVRTGMTAMAKTPLDNLEEEDVADEDSLVDHSNLPPG